jgi:hypothetical protein
LIKTLEDQIGQFLLGCYCLVSRYFVIQEQEHFNELTAAFLLQNVLQLQQQSSVILRVESLALCKIIKEVDDVLIPKKSRGEIFQGNFALGIFWGGVSRYESNPLIVTLSSGLSDITRFRAWSPITTGNDLDSAEKKSVFCPDDWHR